MAPHPRRKTYLATTLNPDEADAFDRIAAELGLNRVELLRQVVRDYVAQWTPQWDTIEADWEAHPQPDLAADLLNRLEHIEARLQALEAPPLALPPPAIAPLEPSTESHPPENAPTAPPPEPILSQPRPPVDPPTPRRQQSPEFLPKTASIYQGSTLSPDQLCRRFNIDRTQIIQSARLLGVKQSAYLEDLTGWTWDAIARVFRESG
ncbi:ribbon-helix-helix domain-containing protein [Spirulina sp.]|uniref:ribbon-helix-helix domain-containing protein n=1 Tax=Spirulina sp. TaxID=1157 RepID=UPI003F6F88BF